MFEVTGDTTTRAIEAALDSLAARQRISAHNIANINTPGFQASRFDFEGDLAKALSRGDDLSDFRGREVRSKLPDNIRGNNVALEEETRDLLTAGLQFEALTQALNFKIGLLQTAAASIQ